MAGFVVRRAVAAAGALVAAALLGVGTASAANSYALVVNGADVAAQSVQTTQGGLAWCSPLLRTQAGSDTNLRVTEETWYELRTFSAPNCGGNEVSYNKFYVVPGRASNGIYVAWAYPSVG